MQQGAKQDLEARQKSISDFMKPMSESLSKIDEKLQDVEKNRVGAYEGLKSQIHTLMTAHKELKNETVNLVHALKTPQVRGRWGEMQLRRVVEMAGMVSHCDFMEQVAGHSNDEKETKLRPDMIVNLPGGQKVIIDAKAPMNAYLEAMETNDPTQKKRCFQNHARLIRHHIKQLSARSYWSQFDPNPEFVVLFLPGEQFFSAALQEDPKLIELGAENKVILSTPTTLIALLRAVSYGWRQEALAENAREISQLGQTLYDRLADLTQHLNKVGRHLGQTVGAYNQAVGSFEQRVMVSARRFETFGIQSKKTTDPIGSVDLKERNLLLNEATQKSKSQVDDVNSTSTPSFKDKG
jgi:DNA recombination protein RmuC